MKTILVTGGSGFVAPHLIKSLAGKYTIFVHVRSLNHKHNIEKLSGVNFFTCPFTVQDLSKHLPNNCTAVVHLAGAVNSKNVETLFESNLVTTYHVLKLMNLLSIPKLIFMSTVAIWGDSFEKIHDEFTAPMPKNPYGYAKFAAEVLIRDACMNGEINSAIVLRGNNTYGPGSTQGVVADFIRQLTEDGSVRIEGDGNQVREPLYVDDLIDLLQKCLAHPTKGFSFYGASGPESYSLLDIASVIAQSMQKPLRIYSAPERPDRDRHLRVSVDQLRKDLNWYPKTSFTSGVSKLLASIVKS